MTRHDKILAVALAELLAFAHLAFLAWAAWRGFDPSLCEAHGACRWRHA